MAVCRDRLKANGLAAIYSVLTVNHTHMAALHVLHIGWKDTAVKHLHHEVGQVPCHMHPALFICTACLTWHTEIGLASKRIHAPPNAHPDRPLWLGGDQFVIRHREPASGLMCHADIGQRWHKLEDAVAICVGLTSVRCSTSVALSRA